MGTIAFRVRTGLIFAILILCHTHPANAQSIWTPPDLTNAVTVEILRPSFDNDDALKFPTAAIFLTLRRRATFYVHLVFELPLVYAKYDAYLGGVESDTVLGNPYFGFELRSENSPFFGEVGVRPPIAGEKHLPGEKHYQARSIGIYSGYIQRMGAHWSKSFSFKGAVNYFTESVSRLKIRLRSGFSMLIPNKKNPEMFLLYSGYLSYSLHKVLLWGGFSGSMLMTEEGLDMSERVMHEVGLGVSLDLSRVQPGITIRLPLDEDLDWLHNVIGICVTVKL